MSLKYMYHTISFLYICDGFRQCGRQDQFSYEGLEALFSYLEEIEEDTGESIEFDPIGLCCEFSEYATATEAAFEYGYEADTENFDAENDALEWLEYRTSVIKLDNDGIIIQCF